MASMEQKKRRRRKVSSGKLMAVDPTEVMKLGKKSADVERLALKYMQKCTVESSTESESDANIEVLGNSTLPGRSLKKTSHVKLQDPYDGDYEELSGASDCSLDSLVDASHGGRMNVLRPPVPEVLTLDDRFPLEGQVSLSDSLGWTISATIEEEEEDCMQLTDSIKSMQSTVREREDLPSRRPFREPECCRATKELQLAMEPSWYAGCDHSKDGERSHEATIPVPMEQDNGVCEDPIIKRKQRWPLLESAGEKLGKKLRVV